MTLELVVEKGTHRASSGYHGRCRLRLRNSQKETLAALELSEVFAGSATQDFRDDISLDAWRLPLDNVLRERRPMRR